MTPKDKAKELVEKYHIKVEVTFTEHSIPSIINAQMLLSSAKQCALIAVDELWNESDYTDGYYQRSVYWDEVKQEICDL